jgi:hypothetical protein
MEENYRIYKGTGTIEILGDSLRGWYALIMLFFSPERIQCTMMEVDTVLQVSNR